MFNVSTIGRISATLRLKYCTDKSKRKDDMSSSQKVYKCTRGINFHEFQKEYVSFGTAGDLSRDWNWVLLTGIRIIF
jgi:hypothetical protein